MAAVVSFDRVTKYFKDGIIPKKKYALHEISFDISPGKTYAYLGPNGAGKTTSLKLILGFLFPSSGKISLFENTPDVPASRQRIGYVSDYPHFYEYLSGSEYLHLCGNLYRLEKSDINEIIPKVLNRVGLADAGDTKLRKYSRGMAQRLNFAQAIMHDPDFVILDEPFNGLDPFGRHDLRSILAELKQAGKTILFSSHILEDAEILAEEVIFINKGEIIKTGTMKDLISSDNSHVKLEELFINLYKDNENR